jgi:hypothetical protein
MGCESWLGCLVNPGSVAARTQGHRARGGTLAKAWGNESGGRTKRGRWQFYFIAYPGEGGGEVAGQQR